MDKYVIERHIEGIGSFSQEQLKAASAKSNEVLDQLGDGISWSHSHVTENQTYCIYYAESVDIILKHSEITGFPANKITKVVCEIDPTTGH